MPGFDPSAALHEISPPSRCQAKTDEHADESGNRIRTCKSSETDLEVKDSARTRVECKVLSQLRHGYHATRLSKAALRPRRRKEAKEAKHKASTKWSRTNLLLK